MCRRLAERFHPGTFSKTWEKEIAETLFKLISEAHSTLSDPEKRRVYDLNIM